MAKIIDGKAVSAAVKENVKKEVEALKASRVEVGLAVVIVGNNPASRVYVNNKKKACEACSINSYEYALPEETTEEELLNLVEKLNNDDSVDGILVQLPLPSQIDEHSIIAAISPEKDVDAFHAENVGKIMIGEYNFLPCTPAGVTELIHSTGVTVEGKDCVVIGRSNIVGTPISILMSRNSKKANCTVTMCHSKTKNLKEICLQADIIIVAIGKPEFLTADMVKEGAVIVDVGIHRIPADNEKGYKIIGDVKYDEVAPKCKAITPVPGGVGPMTIAMLMKKAN